MLYKCEVLSTDMHKFQVQPLHCKNDVIFLAGPHFSGFCLHIHVTEWEVLQAKCGVKMVFRQDIFISLQFLYSWTQTFKWLCLNYGAKSWSTPLFQSLSWRQNFEFPSETTLTSSYLAFQNTKKENVSNADKPLKEHTQQTTQRYSMFVKVLLFSEPLSAWNSCI